MKLDVMMTTSGNKKTSSGMEKINEVLQCCSGSNKNMKEERSGEMCLLIKKGGEYT